jgi:hypothetical protein
MSSHVRNSHKKQYPKWSKDPNRLQPVEAKSQERHKSVKPPRKATIAEPPAKIAEPLQAVESVPSTTNGDGALGLLNQAREQLVDRKEIIESELSKMEDLRTELGRIDAQIESLDGTLGVFKTA